MNCPNSPSYRFNYLLLCVTGLLLVGCKSTTTIDEYRGAQTNIQLSDSVVVLGRRHGTDEETEVDFINCVGSGLTSSVNVIPEQRFLDAVYPWFETSTAPMDVKNLDKLLQNDSLARKFKELQIRYFIWIDGFTEKTGSRGSMTCAVGPGGGGCFGFASWDDEANYEASIWDLENIQLSGKISTATQGTSYVPAVIIPIPLLARVQSNACSSMANQLESFLNPGAASASACENGSC